MKWFFIILSAAFACQWDSAMFILSNMYKTAFFMTRYEYEGLFDAKYKKELSWGRKIFCLEEYATEPMMQILHCKEEAKERKVLQRHPGRVTEKCSIGGESFVIKRGELKGFFHNMILMGLGVNVWNNAHWMKDKGIPVLKPIAFVEERTWNKTRTFVIYLHEGKTCEDAMRKSEVIFPKLQAFEELLSQKRVIHPDFRSRNIVVLDDETIQCIDIDTIHQYPKGSYLFRARMKREVRKFNDNLHEQTGSPSTLVV